MILKNIEIKARINDYEKIKKLIEDICSIPIEIEQQEDTFFNTKHGRLKLREGDGESAIMYYNRSDSHEPKQSDIALSFIDNPNALKTVLDKSIGIRGTVSKKRILYKYEQTRIHLDNVKGLGKFIELEVVLKPDQTSSDGEIIAYKLMEKLGIQKNDLIDVAYIDLIKTNS